MARSYCPTRGDIVWVTFAYQGGHEQAGRRPALTLSPEDYNRRSGLALLCPITSRRRDWPFEVLLPEGLEVSGVVLSDQMRSLDWRAQQARFLCQAPKTVTTEALGKIASLLVE